MTAISIDRSLATLRSPHHTVPASSPARESPWTGKILSFENEKNCGRIPIALIFRLGYTNKSLSRSFSLHTHIHDMYIYILYICICVCVSVCVTAYIYIICKIKYNIYIYIFTIICPSLQYQRIRIPLYGPSRHPPHHSRAPNGVQPGA